MGRGGEQVRIDSKTIKRIRPNSGNEAKQIGSDRTPDTTPQYDLSCRYVFSGLDCALVALLNADIVADERYL